MTIVLTGGGSGGHITPLLAVAHELKLADPSLRIVYIGERGGKFGHVAQASADIDVHKSVFAGKFRRYHGESLLTKLLDIKTWLLNIRDVFYVLIGLVQAIWLVRRLRPQAVFIKGGFVGVPVGLAAALWHVPFATHDSDTVPGLANRIIGRWATRHLVGMPLGYYSYPKEKATWVGIPLEHDFVPVTPKLQAGYKEELGLDATKPLLFITGGSLGAQKLNALVRAAVPSLLDGVPALQIIHQVGKGNLGLYDDITDRWRQAVQEREFVEHLERYSGAADVIITRAGATTIAQFAVQAKACIVVPNPFLTSGHQLKNAQHLARQNAVLVVSENAHPDSLSQEVFNLLGSSEQRQELAMHLAKLAKPDAAKAISNALLALAQPQKGGV